MAKHASFMPKYGNFENQPLSWKPLPIEQKYAQFRHPGIERGCMCNFWNFGPWPSWLLSRAPRPMGLLLLTWDPMGVKISKRDNSSYNYDSFSIKLFLNVPCNRAHTSL